ncbi:hypothetical protein L3081_24400 [Colwellia sp. MSW7]|jgi:hypothetical protein|uniref:Uncharacterized protein n=1 Tax=Colwellia maritima TaxID=2912588 RepID=A0ABS9X915_9GAMM|nr:hypothetical protein [Colwellia maritima]MCI2285971.1 hypothetical protein [Colwellia maritima]
MIKNEYVEVRNKRNTVIVRAKSGKQIDRLLKKLGMFNLLGESLNKVNLVTSFNLPLGTIFQGEI